MTTTYVQKCEAMTTTYVQKCEAMTTTYVQKVSFISSFFLLRKKNIIGGLVIAAKILALVRSPGHILTITNTP